MSKKRGKRTCPGCGKSLKPKWRSCPRCQRLVPVRAVKSAGPVPARFAGKRALRPALRVVCRNGDVTAAKGSFCTVCGIPLGTAVPPLSLVSSNKGVDRFWTNYLGKSDDPAARELLWQARHPEFRLDGGESA